MQLSRISLLPPSLAPRGLSRLQSAEYIGVGGTKFDEMVADGRMPAPVKIDGRTVWDRAKIDEAFAALSETAGPQGNPWDKL
jgi:predicted DNA-binding transcriptional regulator AlpA